MTPIEDILNLERIDDNIYRGIPAESGLVRTFGGHVAAQALVAATRTVGDDKKVHSLHGYFLRPGNAAQETVFVVDRVRDGRSFTTRSVSAIQNGKTIFTMEASFHIRGDKGPEHSDTMRTVPDPELVPAHNLPYAPPELLEEWSLFELRIVEPKDYDHNKYAASQQVVWFKSKAPLPDDETFHICALAYMSDMTLIHSTTLPHKEEKVDIASLDHAMWFLRPFRADEWLVYDQFSPSAADGRALAHGRIFDQQGNLVAMVTQEGLNRYSEQ